MCNNLRDGDCNDCGNTVDSRCTVQQNLKHATMIIITIIYNYENNKIYIVIHYYYYGDI